MWPDNETDIGYGLPLWIHLPSDWIGVKFESVKSGGVKYEIENGDYDLTFGYWLDELATRGNRLLDKQQEPTEDVEFLTVWKYTQSDPDYWGEYPDPEWELIGLLDENRLNEIAVKEKEKELGVN